MSKEEEVKQFIRGVADDTVAKGYYLNQCVETVHRYTESFLSIANGTNDSSAKAVYAAFFSAQKELLYAAKVTAEAAKAGYDWCEGTQKTLVKKKVR